MARWTKPSGMEIETNDEKLTIEYCEALGWQRDKGAGGKAKPKAKPKAAKSEAAEPEAAEPEAAEPEAAEPEPVPRRRGHPAVE